jgi:hypothetical protein
MDYIRDNIDIMYKKIKLSYPPIKKQIWNFLNKSNLAKTIFTFYYFFVLLEL